MMEYGDVMAQCKVGADILFVLDKSNFAGEAGQVRPGKIVRVWDGQSEANPGYVNAVIFCDGSNDGSNRETPCLFWATSITHDGNKGERSYHFPEEA